MSEVTSTGDESGSRRRDEGGEGLATPAAPHDERENGIEHGHGGGREEDGEVGVGESVVGVAVPEGDLASALRALEDAFLGRMASGGGGVDARYAASTTTTGADPDGTNTGTGETTVTPTVGSNPDDAAGGAAEPAVPAVDGEVRRALSETGAAVRHQLRRLARGVPPGGEYDALFANGGIARGGDEDEDGGDADGSRSDSDSDSYLSSDVSDDDDVGDENVDPDEEEGTFLDREAVARVRSLRMQVRAAGGRLDGLRRGAPRRAGRLVAEEMDTIAQFISSVNAEEAGDDTNDGDVPLAGEGRCAGGGDASSSTPDRRGGQNLLRVLTDANGDDDSGGGGSTADDADDISPTNRNAIKNMQDSLDRLNELLDRVNGELPDQLESYRETNEVVDAYIGRRTRGDRDDRGGYRYEPSNRFERAMLSGGDDGDEKRKPREESTAQEQLSPKSRFVNFLCGGSKAT